MIIFLLNVKFKINTFITRLIKSGYYRNKKVSPVIEITLSEIKIKQKVREKNLGSNLKILLYFLNNNEQLLIFINNLLLFNYPKPK